MFLLVYPTFETEMVINTKGKVMKHSNCTLSLLLVAGGLAVLLLSLLVGMPTAQAVDVSLPSTPPRYEITDLGSLGGDYSYGDSINDAGQVVGDAETSSGVNHAFLWQGGVMTDLGTLGGSRGSRATAISEAGQVVGYSFVRDGLGIMQHAFLWQDGVMTDLGTLGGTESYAYDINRYGLVPGGSYIGTGGRYHAFVWGNGFMRDLNSMIPPTPPIEITNAAAITDDGRIVGTASFATPGHVHAFLFLLAQHSITDLGTLGGEDSFPYDINDSGQVVGVSMTSDGWLHAFLWSGGVMTDLGTLGGDMCNAQAINDAGQVVGISSDSSNSNNSAFLWQNGTMVDLNTLIPSNSGWHLEYATDINEHGQIVGYGIIGGMEHAYLLTPIQFSVVPTPVLIPMPTKEFIPMPTRDWLPAATPSP